MPVIHDPKNGQFVTTSSGEKVSATPGGVTQHTDHAAANRHVSALEKAGYNAYRGSLLVHHGEKTKRGSNPYGLSGNSPDSTEQVAWKRKEAGKDSLKSSPDFSSGSGEWPGRVL